MRLRSGYYYNEFPTIDFDYASACWRLNKIKIKGIKKPNTIGKKLNRYGRIGFF